MNNEIAKFLEDNYRTSGIDQEKAILERLAKADIVTSKLDKGLEGAFFSLNEKKMQAIIKATTSDMKKAEHAMLRMANDQYRKTIFNAQTMANSGAFTLKQSIDKATKDFLKAGINCIEYKGGRRVNIATYAQMAVRTANKRAMLVSDGDARNALGIHTVRISKYGQCSETCLPYQGKVFVDDVYSGGTKEEAERLNLTLLSVAIAGGLFHPNCKHKSTTYFYDLKEELYDADGDVENPADEQEHRKNSLRIQQQERLATGSLDPLNIAEATHNKEMWMEKDELLMGVENNRELDYIPNEFVYSVQKENNIRDIFVSIDKSFLNDGFEHMAIANYGDGKLLKPIISSHNKKAVVPDDEVFDFIVNAKEKSITTIHNHPNAGPFSITDIITTNIYNTIAESIVINSNAEVYYLSIPKGKEIDLSNDELKDNFSNAIMKLRGKYKKRFPQLSKNDINHLAYAKTCERLGWHYGRKKY